MVQVRGKLGELIWPIWGLMEESELQFEQKLSVHQQQVTLEIGFLHYHVKRTSLCNRREVLDGIQEPRSDRWSGVQHPGANSTRISSKPHHAVDKTTITMSSSASSRETSSSPEKKPLAAKDLINRGVYKSNPLGTSTFVGLRALDPLLQFQLLRHGYGEALLSSLNITPLSRIESTLLSRSVSDVDLSLLSSSIGLPLPRLILLLMATGSSIKQIFWLLRTSKEEFPVSAALSVSAYNTVVNSLASLLLLAASTSSALATPTLVIPIPYLGTASLSLPTAVGSMLYITGMYVEASSEIKRKNFKDDPKNKGKICDQGLWGKARHVNYAGYTLWRTGYALAAGGWIAGAAFAAWHYWTFAYRSIGLMDEYMSGRYKEQWDRYKVEVPWKLFPGVY
ncbi:hypothetical protein B0H66DRAFT_582357 [Apodospora peruviana]|uniref:Steroid 5-alpha reductase C-terminal domain-containing protein n=1 Tax=Apodospora peruviana TaxID=516989 RepID=A0AAE0I5L1_9PEZI|nr:hypothetical protein B0H66DRAFT_582357 [Apodospora peruviana]